MAEFAVRTPWTLQRTSGEVVQVYWWLRLNVDSAVVEELLRIIAAKWDDVARVLRCNENASSDRYFKHFDIDEFAEESRNSKRCRKMLTKWLHANDRHNVGALFNALHEAGFGRLADEKLSGSLVEEVQHITPLPVSGDKTSAGASGHHGNERVGVAETAGPQGRGIDFLAAPAHELDVVYEQLEGMLELEEQRRLANILLATVGFPQGETAARNEATKYRCSVFRATMMLWIRKADRADGGMFLDALRKVSMQKARLGQRYLQLGM